MYISPVVVVELSLTIVRRLDFIKGQLAQLTYLFI